MSEALNFNYDDDEALSPAWKAAMDYAEEAHQRWVNGETDVMPDDDPALWALEAAAINEDPELVQHLFKVVREDN